MAYGPRAAALLILAAGGPAMAADVVSPKPDAVAVTIYRDRPMTTQALAALGDDDTHGLALVVETRTIDLPAGRSRLRFEGVDSSFGSVTSVSIKNCFRKWNELIDRMRIECA